MESQHKMAASAYEMKSGQFTLPNLRLLNTDMDNFADQLERQVSQSPAFFLNTPVVIDLGYLTEQNAEVDFALLVGLMRGHGMVPIGIRGGTKRQQELAELMELAVLSDGNPSANKTASGQKPTARPQARKPVDSLRPSVSKIVTTPVRSGQRVYASGCDLILTSQVSSGAEVIADGNIHVYGALRGRALAGVKGNRNARIFCHNLQAELVAIAGNYLVNEAIKQDDMNKPVQIFLTGKSLNIQAL